jgi:hypothetical protein
VAKFGELRGVERHSRPPYAGLSAPGATGREVGVRPTARRAAHDVITGINATWPKLTSTSCCLAGDRADLRVDHGCDCRTCLTAPTCPCSATASCPPATLPR